MRVALIALACLLLALATLALSINRTTMHTDTVIVRLLEPAGSLTPPVRVPKIVKSDAAWRAQLTDTQYRITRAQGTERAFCGLFHDNHRTGIYTCIGCGLPLFQSDTKFDSGTGWPSFFQPLARENIGETIDRNLGMTRTEIHCIRCDSHLGHVFADGPAPTGLRYCINSDSLSFHDRPVPPMQHEKVMFGAGCFWGVQDTFDQVKGVTATRAGYAGGHTRQPTYEDVCSHRTGHAEVVEVEFDPAQISFEELLDAFWQNVDPFAEQQAGPEIGAQYRSAIFFTEPEQEAAARESAARLARQSPGRRVTTEIGLATFYAAEEYHQKYHQKHGLKSCSF